MVNLDGVCQLPRVAAVLVAATGSLAGSSIAEAKADHDNNSHHIIPVVKNEGKVDPTDVLGFSAKNGIVSVTEFTGAAGGLRFVSFGGGSMTLSNPVTNSLRPGVSNGKAGNIEVDNTISVKQNPDGSVTITTFPPTLIGR